MEIGFQGTNPLTDFRTGVPALLQLHAYVSEHGEAARDLVARTELPMRGLPLPLVSMAVTVWLHTLLRERSLSAWAFTPVGLLWEVTVTGAKSGAGAPPAPKGALCGPDAPAHGVPCTAGEELAVVTLNALHAAVLNAFVAHWWAAAPPDMTAFERLWGSWRASTGKALVAATAEAFARRVMAQTAPEGPSPELPLTPPGAP